MPVVGGHPVPAAARASLDRMLELLDRRRLSAMDLRLLLALTDGRATPGELARMLTRHPLVIRYAARRLKSLGLVRHQTDSERGPVLSITWTGITAVRPLLAAASWPTLRAPDS
jgi:hypothetical protein